MSKALNQLKALKVLGLKWVCLTCGGCQTKRTMIFEPSMSCEGDYRDNCSRCHSDLIESIEETIKRYEEKEAASNVGH